MFHDGGLRLASCRTMSSATKCLRCVIALYFCATSFLLYEAATQCCDLPRPMVGTRYKKDNVHFFWNEIPYRGLRKGARRKKLRPKVVTTLFAIVVSRVACACFSVCLSLS